MKTDKLFYELFRIQPNLILRLLPELPRDAGSYGFQAPVLKESEYRLDGFLEPQDGSQGLPLVILEAQMYSDPDFLLKLYAQSGCLLHQRLGRQRLPAAREAGAAPLVAMRRHRHRATGWRW